MDVTTSTATPLAALSITSVRDSAGTLIPDSTTTQDTELTLSGMGPVGRVVRILDNGNVITTASVTVAGTWEISVIVALGVHSFTVSVDGAESPPWVITVVAEPTLDLLRPRVPKAYGDGTHLNFDSAMYEDSYLSVMVGYTGMKVGQKIRLRWRGAVVYESEIKTVSAIGDVEFRIPRLEVVDVIGRAASIDYTVTLGNGTVVGPSVVLPLKVDAQPLDLVPPTITSDNRIVTVLYPGMNTPQTGRARWSGVVAHDTGEQNLDTRPENFDIPSAWISENSGREVLINYTVYRNDGQHLLFSRVLRKRM
ncbi:MAG TPA: hypothetical protein VF671_03025 [Pseudomonas sp.]|jgi:hypothetical protein|uniref:hypothetical protein n=1 Tax=Pseudomonas sp. TaxID=306 RepID=UPI002ED96300